MARRKYGRSEATSTAGHAAHPRDPAGDESLAQPIEPKSEYGKVPPESKPESEPIYDIGGLKTQIDHMRQQQAAQQQPQQQADPLAMYLASIPGLTLPKFHFLYHYFAQRPHLLNGDHWQLLRAAHDITIKERKIPEDTNEYFAHMHSLLNQHAAPPPPTAPPMPPPMPQPAPQHVAPIDLESHDGEPEMPKPQNVSAPVSRESFAVEHQPSETSIRLTPAQRDHAQAAGVDEITYARNLLRMERMKKSGLIK
jgi:hypothetical protein